MDISINQRLKKIIDLKIIDAPALYKKIGVDRTTWSGWINANKAISVEKLVLILNELTKIDARWLLTGVGEMITNTGDIPELVEEPKADYKNGCNQCADKERIIESLVKRIADKEHIIELLSKKETPASDSPQFGEGAKQYKAG